MKRCIFSQHRHRILQSSLFFLYVYYESGQMLLIRRLPIKLNDTKTWNIKLYRSLSVFIFETLRATVICCCVSSLWSFIASLDRDLMSTCCTLALSMVLILLTGGSCCALSLSFSFAQASVKAAVSWRFQPITYHV